MMHNTLPKNYLLGGTLYYNGMNKSSAVYFPSGVNTIPFAERMAILMLYSILL